MRAVVAGMIATYPVGGVVWDYAQYVLGLEELGFEVFYLEDCGTETYDPRQRLYGQDCCYGVDYLAGALTALSPRLADRWHFRDMSGGSHGRPAAEMAEIVAEADVFLNVSGSAMLRDGYMPCQRKVLIDTDPGWNHFVNYPRADRGGGWPGTHGYRAHDHFLTYAERIGMPGCSLPTLGLDWQPTRPPVALDQWAGQGDGKFWTTVMTWNNFGKPIEHDGVIYGTKEMEFSGIEALPRAVPNATLEVAVGGSGAPVEQWRDIGWRVVDAHDVSQTPGQYRDYIQGSRGEFSVAKNLYVATGSGWFSCRSVCYLAAGLPAVLQDTGFSDVVPTGEGLFAFADRKDAATAICTVEADHAGHRQAARQLAESHFAAPVVLGELLDRIGLG